MRDDADVSEAGWPRGWVAAGWLLTLALAGVALSALSLPALSPAGEPPVQARDVFRPEWLVLAAFLTYPVRRVARASIPLGAVALVAASAQVIAIADLATERLASAGLTSSAVLWFTVALVEVTGFLVAATGGWRRRWSDRRWERLTRRLSRRSRTPRLTS